MAKNKYDYVIWDWNGTLYNDVIAGIDTINDMLVERNLPPLDIERYKEIFGFPIISYYKKAGFDFSVEPYEQLASVFIKKNNARLGESKLSEGAKSVLQDIQGRGIKQLILSATRQDILHLQVNLFDISNLFCAILGKSDFYAYGKDEIAKAWLSGIKQDPKKILIVGDTLHDYEVSKVLSCECILVSNGHQSKKRLQTTDAKVVNSLSEILQEI